MNLKKARLEHNPPISANQLALRCGVSRQMISYIELGQTKPSVKLAKKIGKELGIEWTKLFED